MSADGQQEPSMEDILASIRKILSEDDGEAKPAEPPKPAPAPPPKAAEPPPPPPAPEPEPEPEPIIEPEPEPAPVMAEPEPEPVASIFEEPPEEPGPDIMAVDPEPEPLQLSMEQQVAPQEQYVPQQQYQPQYPPQQYQQDYQHHQYLVSDPAAQAAGASIAGLAQAVARERAIALGNSGITLEQLVREICTPVLKQWLDTNLPYMVERIVKQEIERIVNRSETM